MSASRHPYWLITSSPGTKHDALAPACGPSRRGAQWFSGFVGGDEGQALVSAFVCMHAQGRAPPAGVECGTKLAVHSPTVNKATTRHTSCLYTFRRIVLDKYLCHPQGAPAGDRSTEQVAVQLEFADEIEMTVGTIAAESVLCLRFVACQKPTLYGGLPVHQPSFGRDHRGIGHDVHAGKQS